VGARRRKEVEDAERCIMRSFVICTPCYAIGEIKSRKWKEEAFCLANLKERGHLEDLELNGRARLKSINK
jgi:hypothetical protein